MCFFIISWAALRGMKDLGHMSEVVWGPSRKLWLKLPGKKALRSFVIVISIKFCLNKIKLKVLFCRTGKK
jgi:hypothetical protein